MSDAGEEERGPEVQGPKKKRPVPVPKDSLTWYRARAKLGPQTFSYTAEGDLQVPEMSGKPAKVITLPWYREAKQEEREVEEERLRQELRRVEAEFDEASEELREALAVWREGGSATAVLRLQKELHTLDAQRTMLRSPVLWTKEYHNPRLRSIFLHEPQPDLSVGHPMYAIRMRTLPFDKQIIASDTPFTPVSEAGAAAGAAPLEETFVFFGDPEDEAHGLLSPDTMLDFVFNGTRYNSPTQAFQGERLLLIGRPELRSILLRSRDVAKMKKFGKQVVGNVPNIRQLWFEILKSFVEQHPEVGEVLRSTGTDALAYADPKEEVFGIGLSADDELATDRQSWPGTNILGQAWEAVRATLPREGALEAMKGGGVKDTGKSLEDVRAERANVFRGMAAAGKKKLRFV